ncbi:MAG: hypothetical protein JJU40_12505, partial [Rhodobacteraceae bacterium]|nr:hypothetical protein [Paracoccaceae bacterium]
VGGARPPATAAGALVISVALQIMLAGRVLALREPILRLLGAEGVAFEVASRFLLISLLSLPMMAFGMVAAAILRSLGDAWRAMMVTVLAGAVAMLVDPFLILSTESVFGYRLPFTLGMGLGADGAAFGLWVSRIAMALMGLWFVIGVHDMLALPRWRHVREMSRPFFRIALPAAATQLSTPVGNFILTGLVAIYGDAAVAGWSVMSRLMVLTFGGLFALSGAIGGIIGQNYGARLLPRVRQTFRSALLFCSFYTLAAWGLLALASPVILSLFGLTGTAADVVLAFTRLAAAGFFFNGALFVANATFNNLGRPLWSTALNWLRDAVMILPFAWLLGQMLGAPGVVYGQALAGVVVGSIAVLVAWRFMNRLQLPPLAGPGVGQAEGLPPVPPPGAPSARAAIALAPAADTRRRLAPRDRGT